MDIAIRFMSYKEFVEFIYKCSHIYGTMWKKLKTPTTAKLNK